MAVHIRRRECIVTLGSAAAVWPLAKGAFTLGIAAFTLAPASLAKAAERPANHGISAFGDLKYAPDFKQFDYVNAETPKGGVFSYVSPTRIFNQNLLTFNSLNSYILAWLIVTVTLDRLSGFLQGGLRPSEECRR